MRRRDAVLLSVAALMAFTLVACGVSGGAGETASGESDLTVLAASSLTDAFETAGKVYEKEHPDVQVKFSFAGSQDLAAQVSQGAPADVVVTADTETMDEIKSDTGDPSVIAKNRPVMVTAEGNPQGVESLDNLADPGTKTVLAAPEVPVGKYSQEVLDNAGVQVDPVSEEPNVRAVLSKVELGEADAGIVYATDAATAPDKVDTIAIPEDDNVVASYPAATVKGSEHPDEAAEFVQWLQGDEAQKILTDAGFDRP
ncbi:molybdate ABC transporter substrate-binding protein [Streptomyces fractus]|uniref:molybdate ABC transporter substrate-binding protein n=1 Tax=Streptomyces fractus TaxID=641806 RepID=UPI003CEB359C